MPPLPPLRVIAVMPDDEPLDAVVAGVNSRHNPNSKPGPSRIVIHEAGTRPGGHSRGQVAVGVGCRWRGPGARGSAPGQWQGFGLRDGLSRDLAGGVQESGQGGIGVVCCPGDLEGELVPHDGDKPDTG